MEKRGENRGDCHLGQVIDNVRETFFMEKIQDGGVGFNNGSLHFPYIDRRDIGGAKMIVDEANDTVDMK